MSLDSISAYHSNEWQVLDDVDRRATAHIADIRDTGLLNNRDLRDFSQELRLSADQGRWRWQLGANYFDTTGEHCFRGSQGWRQPGQRHGTMKYRL